MLIRLKNWHLERIETQMWRDGIDAHKKRRAEQLDADLDRFRRSLVTWLMKLNDDH